MYILLKVVPTFNDGELAALPIHYFQYKYYLGNPTSKQFP